ncbi:helix-turn-helix transcriptional regulator [Ligilactobacillus sp. WILCCON 0076]|uniref:Helix-turn-helix transcriptional regulator n=1 Tax=Ligilactobacillus ubinensis TaxID=2876789 RepID=A0A9X2FGA4_9LACO|nr:helix-turn-helix transcriptional regulator [Ligilactobacillus ubinensis]MCP0885889.1 helix-turn-helix transcriptional regulator [Ligilactobacillus ubinensis]
MTGIVHAVREAGYINSYLKEFRKKKGLKQQEMADVLKISYSHYVKVENDFVNPSFELLKRIKEKYRDFNVNKLFK